MEFVTTGASGSKVRRLAARSIRRGRAYLHGTTADMMVQSYVLDAVHRAVALWLDPGKRSFAQAKVKELMAHIPYDLFERMPWVSGLFEAIVNSTEDDVVPLRVTTQSSGPSPVPATDAGSSAAQQTGDVVQDVSQRLGGLWQTKEFFVTLQNLRVAGECKLTLWAAQNQCRLRLHEYT